MRVLFVAPYVPSLIRVRPYQLIRELAKQHEVVVLAAAPRSELSDVPPLREIAASVDVEPLRVTRELRSCARAALRGDPLQAAICHSAELDARLRGLLARERFDVVHVEHLRAARLVDLLPPAMPRLFDTVDSISLLWDRTLRSSHSFKQRLLAKLELRRTRAFERRSLARFDETIVTSPDDRSFLLGLAPGASITVVPNGVDLDYFVPREEPPEPDTIVFSGKMSYHANVTAALFFAREVLPRVRAARPGARLRIVGSRPPAAIQALSRDPGIDITGYVPDIRPHVARAVVAVCPVRVKVGIQNKLLEAMAMAVPVVATREGASGLAAEPGADLLVADCPEQMARQVIEVLSDRALADRLGTAGRAYVLRHHQWRAAAATVTDRYEAAIARREGAVTRQSGV